MSDRRFITSGTGLPRWSNPISHAVVVNDMCFVSGQLSVNEAGEYVPGDIAAEAERAFANLFAAVHAAGFRPEEIVFVDLAFTDLSEVGAVDELFARLFPEGRRPARTIYEAAGLPFGGKIKVMATAVRDRDPR